MFTFDRETLKDKIYACWLGKNIGGTMGTPYEGKTELQDIQGFVTKPGEVLPNDDLDLQLVWLRCIEDRGPYSLTSETLAEYWASYIPPNWNEYGICKNNMRAGLQAPLCGEYNNPWKHSNGAWIRTEVWACMAPGYPDVAIRYSKMDAAVDHGMGEGTFAAVFVAAVEAAAFVVNDLRRLIEIGLSKIPADCRVSKTIRHLLDCRDKGMDWKETRASLVKETEDLGWFQAPANVAFAMLGLLYGEGDFKKSMILAINCGDDTDCTGATLGSIFGIMNGTKGIPEDWRAYIGDSIVTVAVDRGSCYRLPNTCTELTDRVFRMIPIVSSANRIGLIVGSANVFPEEDIARLSDGKIVETLRAESGLAVESDFIWGKCRAEFPEGIDVRPGKSLPIRLTVTNNLPGGQKKFDLTWVLPEGFAVDCRKSFLLMTPTRYTAGTLVIDATVTAGEKVDGVNRLVACFVGDGRPTPGFLGISLLG